MMIFILEICWEKCWCKGILFVHTRHRSVISSSQTARLVLDLMLPDCLAGSSLVERSCYRSQRKSRCARQGKSSAGRCGRLHDQALRYKGASCPYHCSAQGKNNMAKPNLFPLAILDMVSFLWQYRAIHEADPNGYAIKPLMENQTGDFKVSLARQNQSGLILTAERSEIAHQQSS